jgi:hypothetical protein
MNVIVLQHKTGIMKVYPDSNSSVLIGVNIVYTHDNMSEVQVEPDAWYFSST